MKKPNTSTMTPGEMRKQAAALLKRAQKAEAVLLPALRERKIAELTAKYADTAWVLPPTTGTPNTQRVMLITGFCSQPGSSCGIRYSYDQMFITRDSKHDIEILFRPGRDCAWFDSEIEDLRAPVDIALVKEYAKTLTSFSSAAVKKLRRLLPEEWRTPKKPAEKLFPKVKKPR